MITLKSSTYKNTALLVEISNYKSRDLKLIQKCSKGTAFLLQISNKPYHVQSSVYDNKLSWGHLRSKSLF